MRALTFDARGQDLRPMGNFSGLVVGSKGYLRAEFTFDEEHADCKHIAVFECLGKEYPVVLTKGKYCEIPAEALTHTSFKVYVVSLRADYRIQTRKVTVRQNV